jgi:nucleoside-diphosphate-sugar epimerase
MLFLVTGAAGFIGSNVSKNLLKSGHLIVGVDDVNDYYDTSLKEWRLRELQAHKNFQFVKENIANNSAMEALFQNYQFDGVFNLAARAGVRASVKDPWIYYETNVKGTLNLLECCQRYGVKKLVLASTSSIYGNTATPFKLENRTDTPLSQYSASKKGAEALCYTYHYLYGVDVSIPRYFTVYGPAGRPDMSYFRFILKIDRGEPIDVYGDGKQARDFTFVEDVAEATVRGLGLSGYHIFNVGNDRPIELLKMIQIVEELLGKKAKLNFLPRHPADNMITWADISETETLLNWRPKIKIEEGLQKVVEWYYENKNWLQTLKLDCK